MDGVSNQLTDVCYDNIRKYLREKRKVDVVNATKNCSIPSSKRRNLLHKLLDEAEDDDEDNKTDGNK